MAQRNYLFCIRCHRLRRGSLSNPATEFVCSNAVRPTILLMNNGGLWPPFGPNGIISVLASQGIALTHVDGSPLDGWSATVASFFSDPNSTIAPSGDTVTFEEFRLTFSHPVYAVGATFVATPESSDPNLPDVVYRVQGMDANGNVLGNGYSSSFSQRNGPVAIHVLVGSSSYYEFLTSFAGIWSDTPIAQANFMLAQPTAELAHRACWSALSFSRTPVASHKAFVQPPINADGSSVFSAVRGVVPVKFTLTQNGLPTCTLTPATIAVTRTSDVPATVIAESIYSTPADIGSSFRIDPTACQYVYNLAASSLGVGTYRVDISIDGNAAGHAVFALQ